MSQSEDLPRDDAGWIIRSDPNSRPRLTGEEAFAGANGATVSDFWRFAMQDLQMNNTRGYLAEFLVGRALGIDSNRVEWDPFDLLWHPNSTDLVRIEVKSSAYLQSWRQKRLSKPSFSGLKGRVLDEDSGAYSKDPDFNADVYVMCLNAQMDPSEFDPLDINMWKFFVVPRYVLVASGFASVDLRWLERQSIRPVTFDVLRKEVDRVWASERAMTSNPGLSPAKKTAKENAKENAKFDVPVPFAEVDDRLNSPCTSCGRASSYDAAQLYVIRSSHDTSEKGHFDIYCPAHLERWIERHR